jgi:hypothetical protein
MKYCEKIFENIPVEKILCELNLHPELWDENKERTGREDSPHKESSDIWLRFRKKSELKKKEDFDTPHFAEFYHSWFCLPSLHPVVFSLMRKVEAVYLGGILITKLAPGKKILPHIDTGWHPEFLNTKAYIILSANENCVNYFPGESAIMKPGEAWLFNNQVLHAVENNGDSERIAVVVTMRVE